MFTPTVETIRGVIDAYAPEDTCESFDNVGLLIGKRDAEVERILVALDATLNVVAEAVRKGCRLIVTHHPLFFHARKKLIEEDAEARVICALIRNEISLIAAHTNLDQTMLSGSACSARLLHMADIEAHGYFVTGKLPYAMSVRDFAALAGETLHTDVRVYGRSDKLLSTIAIGGGAYDEGYHEAMALGADAMLTGEVRHHNALSADMDGFVLMDGGHYATEAPLVPAFSAYLQNTLDALQCTVQVILSSVEVYRGGRK